MSLLKIDYQGLRLERVRASRQFDGRSFVNRSGKGPGLKSSPLPLLGRALWLSIALPMGEVRAISMMLSSAGPQASRSARPSPSASPASGVQGREPNGVRQNWAGDIPTVDDGGD